MALLWRYESPSLETSKHEHRISNRLRMQVSACSRLSLGHEDGHRESTTEPMWRKGPNRVTKEGRQTLGQAEPLQKLGMRSEDEFARELCAAR